MAVAVAPPEILSPDLVLVDPRVAEARASLSDPDEIRVKREPRGAAATVDDIAAARQRLIELSDVRRGHSSGAFEQQSS